ALPGGSVRTCFRLVEPLTAPVPADQVPAGRAEPADRVGSAGGAEAEDDAEPAVVAALGDWRGGVSLPSAADPRPVLPAADVWDGTGYGWLRGVLPRHAGHPEEELLAGLGTAARLFPALDAALREAAPAEVTLDTAGALGFLRETGPLLSGAGFGVLMPD